MLDNLFRESSGVALVGMAAVAAAASGATTAEGEERGKLYSALVLTLFSLPFIVLGPIAGSLGDKLPKHLIVRAARIADLPICLIAVAGFAWQSPVLLLGALLALTTASSCFAPVKLALVPELVPPKRLAVANATLAAVTILTIITGTCLAAVADPDVVKAIGATCGVALVPWHLLLGLSLGLCGLGIWGAFRLPVLPAQAPATPIAKPWAFIDLIRVLRATPGVTLPAVCLAAFWALGAAAFTGLIPLSKHLYHFDQAGTAILVLPLVFGIASGSLLSPALLARAFPAGLPTAGAVIAGTGLALAGVAAAFDGQGHVYDHALPLAVQLHHLPRKFMAAFFVCGFGAGLWEVPLAVLLQQRAPAGRRNQIMAATSVLGSLGTLAASVVLMGLDLLGVSSQDDFMLLGGLAIVAAIVVGLWLRRQVAGWAISLLIRTIWRVRAEGLEHLPAQGGCLVICNHLSYADGLVMAAVMPRPVRFLVYRGFTQMPFVGWFLNLAGVIPVAETDRRRALLGAIEAARAAAAAGEVVAIFPEGKLTRSGQTDVFRSGMERIAGGAQVPVVPAHLHGLYGSAVSRAPKRLWPRLRPSVHLTVGAPLPADTSAETARDRVMELGWQLAERRALADGRTLGRAWISAARRHPFAPAVRDAAGGLHHWQLGGVARALVPALGLAADEGAVGVVLPPGRAGAIVNLALAFAGRTAVNLNHTAGAAQLARMCEIAGIRTIVSSRLYLRKIGDPALPGRVLLAEDLLPMVSQAAVMLWAVVHWCLPASWLVHGRADDAAAIVFSSGTTGDPKGVMLSHRQVLANCRAVTEGLNLKAGADSVLSPLPLFHSFGLMPGMWLGLTSGIGVAAHPDPTDAKTLGELAAATRATFLISTPTFARAYLRRVEPAQFASMKYAVVGAERCPEELKMKFRERFNVDLLEGYGCTELAPVVSTNLPDHQADGMVEVRNRAGTVGRPLPGLHVFAVDRDTHAPLPSGSEGLLVVRSASRMSGYLGRADLTDKAFVAGGYNTGDIGKVDGEGFITITGRFSRFAKIAGEMVPLDNVEGALQTALAALTTAAPAGQAVNAPVPGDAAATPAMAPPTPTGPAPDAVELAVAAVPDEARGERLVILHTGFTGDWEALIARIEHLPPLWRPKARDAVKVPAIPKLGTGKRDLAAIARLAKETKA